MYEGAHRAFIHGTTNHSRDDANSAREADIGDCQCYRKCLRRSRFRNSHARQSILRRCRCASSKLPEDALRGL
jgi:hypothetical protein